MATTLPEKGAENVVYVVDLSGYVFRAYHAITQPLSSPTGEPTHATLGTITMLERMIAERRPVHLIVAMDSKAPSFRKAMYAEYKANRPPPPEDLSIQMTRCREIVEAYRFQVLQAEGIEADDFIGAAVRCAREHKMRVVIVSADKDLMQLVGEDVVQWDTMRNKVYGPAEVTEKLGVPPSQVRDYLALTGDASDNVPGVPSVGPKTAAELLKEHGTLEGIYLAIDKITRKKLREMLVLHEADALLSQRLVSLKDDLVVDVTSESARVGARDVEKLRTLFTTLGFTRLLAGLGEPKPSATPVGEVIAKTETETVMATSVSAPISTEEALPGQLSLGIDDGAVVRETKTISQESELVDFVAKAKSAEWLSLAIETDGKDPARSKLIGISLSIEPTLGFYLPLAHTPIDGAPAQLSLETVQRLLGPLLLGDAPAKTAHDGKHVEVVLLRHGLPLGKIGFDVMIADYLIDSEPQHELKEIAKRVLSEAMTSYDEVTEKVRGKQLAFHDVSIEKATKYAGLKAAITLELTRRLAPEIESQGLSKVLNNVELPLAKMLVGIESHGVLVDVTRLGEIGVLVDRDLLALESKAKEIAGKDFNLGSPRQLETLLFDELKLRVIKRTKTSRSTDAEVLEALAEEHPLPAVILEHRMLAKLKGTYIDSLPLLVNPRTKRIHTTYGQTIAATGRLSSIDPNLQNIPIRTEVGKAIRGAFVAPPGHVLVSADYSQIELRVLADLSKDPVLVDAFSSGQDIHTRTAMEVFGKSEDAVGEDERRAAKTINFGVIYGMGDSALAKRLGIPRAEAATFIKSYFERYAGVRKYFDHVLEEARASNSVSTMLGRRRFLPDLQSAHRGHRFQAERIAQNTPIQGSAADILKLAMLALAKPVVEGAQMILSVHDELVFEVPESRIEEAEIKIRAAMEGVVKLSVPLLVEAGHGHTWAEAH